MVTAELARVVAAVTAEPPIYVWLLGALMGLFLMVLGWLQTAMSGRVTEVEKLASATARELARTDERTVQLVTTVERIEAKLDRVLGSLPTRTRS